MVKAMVAVAMTEVGLVLLNLERGLIRVEREGDGRCRHGWSKSTGPQRFHAQQVYRNWTQSLRELSNVGNGLGEQDKTRRDEIREWTDRECIVNYN